MKVIFMGTPDFAVNTLEKIIEAGHEVMLVVTQPDKPKGRGNTMQFPPVKECAVSHGLEVFQPVKIREDASVEYLKKFAPDIIIVAAFGQILPKSILDLPKYGCINVHASLLPKYRGAAPIQWAVINGDEITGVTIMRMDVGLDTGDMLATQEVPLLGTETGESLFDQLSTLGGPLLLKTLEEIENGEVKPVKQKDEESTYAKMLTREMGELDFQEEAVRLERYVRGLNSWPSAYTHYHGKLLKIWEADVVDNDSEGRPGEIVELQKDGFLIQTGKGCLKARQVQLEGKKRMAAGDFLRGMQMKAGDLLGCEE